MKFMAFFLSLTFLSSAFARPGIYHMFDCSATRQASSLPQDAILSIGDDIFSFGEITSVEYWGLIGGKATYTASYSGVSDHRKVAFIKADPKLLRGKNGLMTIDVSEDKQTYRCTRHIKDPNQG